ncbi:MAG TPA: GNAT family N-acetyltransferase [Xanthomonadaceae bacterium]|nr:GNAT family N-acetyltransferase [Xanthomonadaceae bacterium]
MSPDFRIEAIDYDAGLPDLRAVRETVFVQEQHVPLEEEWDALDPHCLHVLARDAHGLPIGTGRLIPPSMDSADGMPMHGAFPPAARIGRMAVLRDWRGRGVGAALLSALLDVARARGWRQVTLNAQLDALPFYARHGFVPAGPIFEEAGIRHRAMCRVLGGATAVDDRDAAVCIVAAILGGARRQVDIYSRDLDPGLFDAAPVLEALRMFATSASGRQLRVLLQDTAAPQRAQPPVLALAQRLPSIFSFRAVEDPVDLAYPSAFVASDTGGWYFRALGHRFDGEAGLDGPARARQLRERFEQIWQRARPASEFRALRI